MVVDETEVTLLPPGHSILIHMVKDKAKLIGPFYKKVHLYGTFEYCGIKFALHQHGIDERNCTVSEFRSGLNAMDCKSFEKDYACVKACLAFLGHYTPEQIRKACQYSKQINPPKTSDECLTALLICSLPWL